MKMGVTARPAKRGSAFAATEAVRTWRYQPYRQHDLPTQFQADVTVSFTLPTDRSPDISFNAFFTMNGIRHGSKDEESGFHSSPRL